MSLREQQKQQRRLIILDAARDLFSEHGYEETTISMVADRAMVSAPTVYNYFGTKPTLLLSIISLAESETANQVHNATDSPHGDPVEKIVSFLKTTIGISLNAVDAKTWRHAYSQIALNTGSEMGEGFKGLNDQLYNALEDLLNNLIASGNLSTQANAAELRGLIERVNFTLFGELISTNSLTFEKYGDTLRAYVDIIIRQYCK